MFTDRPGTGGMELNLRVKLATKELSLAFMQTRLGIGSPLALSLWVERYRAIIAKHDGAFGKT